MYCKEKKIKYKKIVIIYQLYIRFVSTCADSYLLYAIAVHKLLIFVVLKNYSYLLGQKISYSKTKIKLTCMANRELL